jgi:hypothetical protein
VEVHSLPGVVKSVPIIIYFDSELPTGTFTRPSAGSSTIYSSETITLEFHVDPSLMAYSSTIKYVDFYIQSSTSPLTLFGPGTPLPNNLFTRTDAVDFDSNDVMFFVNITDGCGNSAWITSGNLTHKFWPVSIQFDENNLLGGYYFESTENVLSGNLHNAELLPGVDGTTEIEVRLDSYYYDETLEDYIYVPLGQSITSMDTAFQFQITWDNDDLPTEYMESKLPVSFIQFANITNPGDVPMAHRNFATHGKLGINTQSQIVLVTAAPYNEIRIFDKKIDSHFNWTVYSLGSYGVAEALSCTIENIDDDAYDEIVLTTASGIIIIEYNTVTHLWVMQHISFDTLQINEEAFVGLAIHENTFYVAENQSITRFNYDTNTSSLILAQSLDLPIDSENIIAVEAENVLGLQTVLLATRNQLLYYNNTEAQFNSIFTTQHQLVPKLAASTPVYNNNTRVVFGVKQWDGLYVISGIFNNTIGENGEWQLRCSHMYDDFTRIYDLQLGQLSAANNLQIVAATETSLDLIETPYEIYRNTVPISIDAAGRSGTGEDIQNGLFDLQTISNPVNWTRDQGYIVAPGQSDEYQNIRELTLDAPEGLITVEDSHHLYEPLTDYANPYAPDSIGNVLVGPQSIAYPDTNSDFIGDYSRTHAATSGGTFTSASQTSSDSLYLKPEQTNWDTETGITHSDNAVLQSASTWNPDISTWNHDVLAADLTMGQFYNPQIYPGESFDLTSLYPIHRYTAPCDELMVYECANSVGAFTDAAISIDIPIQNIGGRVRMSAMGLVRVQHSYRKDPLFGLTTYEATYNIWKLKTKVEIVHDGETAGVFNPSYGSGNWRHSYEYLYVGTDKASQPTYGYLDSNWGYNSTDPLGNPIAPDLDFPIPQYDAGTQVSIRISFETPHPIEYMQAIDFDGTDSSTIYNDHRLIDVWPKYLGRHILLKYFEIDYNADSTYEQPINPTYTLPNIKTVTPLELDDNNLMRVPVAGENMFNNFDRIYGEMTYNIADRYNIFTAYGNKFSENDQTSWTYDDYHKLGASFNGFQIQSIQALLYPDGDTSTPTILPLTITAVPVTSQIYTARFELICSDFPISVDYIEIETFISWNFGVQLRDIENEIYNGLIIEADRSISHQFSGDANLKEPNYEEWDDNNQYTIRNLVTFEIDYQYCETSDFDQDLLTPEGLDYLRFTYPMQVKFNSSMFGPLNATAAALVRESLQLKFTIEILNFSSYNNPQWIPYISYLYNDLGTAITTAHPCTIDQFTLGMHLHKSDLQNFVLRYDDSFFNYTSEQWQAWGHADLSVRITTEFEFDDPYVFALFNSPYERLVTILTTQENAISSDQIIFRPSQVENSLDGKSSFELNYPLDELNIPNINTEDFNRSRIEADFTFQMTSPSLIISNKGMVNSFTTGFTEFRVDHQNANHEDILLLNATDVSNARTETHWNRSFISGGFYLMAPVLIGEAFTLSFMDSITDVSSAMVFEFIFNNNNVHLNNGTDLIDLNITDYDLNWRYLQFNYYSGILSLRCDGILLGEYLTTDRPIDFVQLHASGSSLVYLDDLWVDCEFDFQHIPNRATIAELLRFGWISDMNLRLDFYGLFSFSTSSIQILNEDSMEFTAHYSGVTEDLVSYLQNDDRLGNITFSLDSALWHRLTPLSNLNLNFLLIDTKFTLRTCYGENFELNQGNKWTPQNDCDNRAQYSKDINVTLDPLSVDINRMIQIAVQIEGTIDLTHWSENIPFSKNLFNPEDYAPALWEDNNNGNTIMQVNRLGSGAGVNLVSSLYPENNPRFDLYGLNPNNSRFLMQYLFFVGGNYQDFFLGTNIGFSIVLDLDFFLRSFEDEFMSSYLQVNISDVSLAITSRFNTSEIPYIQHENYQDISFDLPDTDALDSLDLELTGDFEITATTLFDVAIPMNDDRLQFLTPEVVLELYHPEGDIVPYSLGSIATSRTSDAYTIDSYIFASFYARDQLAEFANINGTISGRISLRWAVQNTFNFPVVFSCNTSTIDANLQSIELVRQQSTLSDDVYRQFDLADVDVDGDVDVILDDGSMLIMAENMATFAMRMQALRIDSNGAELVSERFFLASLDIGRPHPEFVNYESKLGQYTVPEFGGIFDLQIYDCSIDLTNITLSYSYDNITYFPLRYNEIDRQNLFTYPLNASQFEEGLIYFKTVVWDNYYPGTAYLTAWIDYSAPSTLLSIDHYNATEALVSIQSTLSFVIEDNATIDYFFVKILTLEGVPLWESRCINPYPRVGEFDTFTYKLIDILMSIGFSGTQFTLQWGSANVATMIETVHQLTLVVDTTYSTIYDATTTTTSKIESVYGSFISGQIIDRFGQPLPEGNQIDIQLDGLTFIRTGVDSLGRFNCSVTSADLYSQDLRQGAVMDGFGIPQAGIIPNRTVNLKYQDGVSSQYRKVTVDGVYRFYYDALPVDTTVQYNQLDLEAYRNTSVQSIHLDLGIPAIYSPYAGTTFERIMVRFIGPEKTFDFNITKDVISQYYEQSPGTFGWNMMLMQHLSIELNIFEILELDSEFELADITTIQIIGYDNEIHPGWSLYDPTTSHQAIVVAGIYAVYSVNDASLMEGQSPAGNVKDYSVRITIQSLIFLGVVAACAAVSMLRVMKSTLSLSAEELDYGHQMTYAQLFELDEIDLTYEGMSFVDEEVSTSNRITDLLQLWTIDTTMADIPVGVSEFGINSTKYFLIGEQPGYYSSLRVRFLGNSFFDPVDTEICSQWEILKNSVNFNMVAPKLGNRYTKDLIQNSTSKLYGEIVTGYSPYFGEGQYMDVVDFESEAMTEITLWNHTAMIGDRGYEYGVWESRQITIPNRSIIIGVWLDFTDFRIIDYASVAGRYFNITFDTTPEGNFGFAPSMTYLCSLIYLGTEFYASATQNLSITILPNSAKLEMERDLKADMEGVWNPETNKLEIVREMTYTDDKDFTFLLTDQQTEKPMVNAPVWLQIGYTPNSPFMDELESGFADSNGDYLVLQSSNAVPEEFWYKQWIQSPTDRPIVYPYNVGGTNADDYRMWAPMYYDMVQTDGEGRAQFNIQGDILWQIVENYTTHLKIGAQSLEDIQLYIRVWYADSLDLQRMQLPHYYTNYEIDFAHPDYVYDTYDDVKTIDDNTYYRNMNQNSTFGEGYISLQKEDTMILAVDQEVVGADSFYLSAQVWEANDNPLDDTQLMAEDNSGSNFINTYGNVKDAFEVELVLNDHMNTTRVIDGKYSESTDTYYPHSNPTAAEGTVSYYAGYESWGPEFSRILPGFYNMHFRPVDNSFGFENPYYNTPITGGAILTVKSEYSYQLDSPSTIYSLSQMLGTNPDTNVAYSNSTEHLGYLDYVPPYPTLTADISVENLTIYPENPELNESVKVAVYLNGVEHEESVVFGGLNETCEATIEIPFTNYIGNVDLAFGVEFNANIEELIDWNEVDEANQTFLEEWLESDYNGFCDTYNSFNEYWETVSNITYQKMYEQFEFESQYQVSIGNIQLHQAYEHQDDTYWNISSEIINPTQYGEDYWCNYNTGEHGDWTYLNESTQEGFTLTADVANDNSHQDIIRDMISISCEDEISINFDQNNYAINEGNLNISLPLEAFFELKNIVQIEKQHNNVSRNITYGSNIFTTYGGFEMDSPTQSDDYIWDHSVRSGVYRYHNAIANETTMTDQDMVAIGLLEGETVDIFTNHMYIPYKAAFDWKILVPYFGEEIPNIQPAFNVTLEIISEYASSYNLIETWEINSSQYRSEDFGLVLDLSMQLPEYLESHLVTFNIKVTSLEAGSESTLFAGLNKIYLLNGFITGEETIISISNIYPDALREQMFSQLFQYFFTSNAKEWGATNTETTMPDLGVNDIYYEITDNSVSGLTRDLPELLSVLDYREYVRVATEQNYEYFDLNDAIFDRLFHNSTNRGTYCEFAPDDTNGVSMLKMRINPDVISNENLKDPLAFSGFVNLYDVTPDGSDKNLMKSRKFTIIVNPSVYIQQSQGGLIPAAQSINLHRPKGSLQPKTTHAAQTEIRYSLAPGPNDIVITNWMDSFRKVGASPIPNDESPIITTDELFYDEQNILTFHDATTWDENMFISTDEQISEVVLNVTANKTAFSFGSGSELMELLTRDTAGYRHLQVPLQFYNSSHIEKVTISAIFSDSTIITTDITGPAPAARELATIDLGVRNDLSQISISLTLNTVDFPTNYNVEIGLLGLGLFKESSVGNLAIRTETNDSIETIQNITLCPSVFAGIARYSPEVINRQIEVDSSNNGSLYDITIAASTSANLSVYSLMILEQSPSPYLPNNQIYHFNFDGRERSTDAIFYELLNPLYNKPAMPWTGSISDFAISDYTSVSYDYNGDQSYDLTIELMNDSIAYDFGSDGFTEYQSVLSSSASIKNATPINEYGDGHYYISKNKFDSLEERFDTTGDGGFDTVNQYYRVISSNPIPSYYGVYSDNGTLKEYDSWEYPTTGTYGIVRSVDQDGDQNYDQTINRMDLWEDSIEHFYDQDGEMNVEHQQYETFTLYDSTGVTEGNALEEYRTFTLLGSRPGGIPIEGDFIFQYDIPVPIDPRTNIPAPFKVDKHGVAAWYDSDNDGSYEMAFIFSEESYKNSTAVGYYISQEQDRKIHLGANTGSSFIPTWWLSSEAGFEAIRAQSIADTRANFEAEIQTDEYWQNYIIDTSAQAIIQILSAMTGGGGLVTLALHTAYNYFIRPQIDNLFEWYGEDQAQELRTDGIPKLGQQWITVFEGGIQLAEDLGLYNFKGFETYPTRILFNNTTPFQENQSQYAPVENYITVDMPILYVEDAEKESGWGGAWKDMIGDNAMWNQIGPGKTYATFGDYWNAKIAPYIVEMLVPSFIRLQFNATSVDDAEQMFSDMTYERYMERRFVHEYYWRRPPGTTPNEFYQDNVYYAENNIQASLAYSTFNTLAGSGGNAVLLAAKKPDMNYSNEICYALELELLSYQSLFHQENQWAYQNDKKIQTIEFIKGVLSTIVSVTAGKYGALNKYYNDYGLGGGVGVGWKAVTDELSIVGFIKEAFTELWVEHAIGSIARKAGFPEFVSEQLAEKLADMITPSTKQDGLKVAQQNIYTSRLNSKLKGTSVQQSQTSQIQGSMTSHFVQAIAFEMAVKEELPKYQAQAKARREIAEMKRMERESINYDQSPQQKRVKAMIDVTRRVKASLGTDYITIDQYFKEKGSWADYDINENSEVVQGLFIYYLGGFRKNLMSHALANPEFRDSLNVGENKYQYCVSIIKGYGRITYNPDGSVMEVLENGKVDHRTIESHETVEYIMLHSDSIQFIDPIMVGESEIEDFVLPFDPSSLIHTYDPSNYQSGSTIIDPNQIVFTDLLQMYNVHKFQNQIAAQSPFLREIMAYSEGERQDVIDRNLPTYKFEPYNPIEITSTFDNFEDIFMQKQFLYDWYSGMDSSVPSFKSKKKDYEDRNNQIRIQIVGHDSSDTINRLEITLGGIKLNPDKNGYYYVPKELLNYHYLDFYKYQIGSTTIDAKIKVVENIEDMETINIYDIPGEALDVPQLVHIMKNQLNTIDFIARSSLALRKQTLTYFDEHYKNLFYLFGRYSSNIREEASTPYSTSLTGELSDNRLFGHIKLIQEAGLTFSRIFGYERIESQESDITNVQLNPGDAHLMEDIGERLFLKMFSDDFLIQDYNDEMNVYEYLTSPAEDFDEGELIESTRGQKKWMKLTIDGNGEGSFSHLFSTVLGDQDVELREILTTENLNWGKKLVEKMKEYSIDDRFKKDSTNRILNRWGGGQLRDTPSWFAISKYLNKVSAKKLSNEGQPIDSIKIFDETGEQFRHLYSKPFGLASGSPMKLEVQKWAIMESLILEFSEILSEDLNTPSPFEIESWSKSIMTNKFDQRASIGDIEMIFRIFNPTTVENRLSIDQEFSLFLKHCDGVLLRQYGRWIDPSYGFGPKQFERIVDNTIQNPAIFQEKINLKELDDWFGKNKLMTHPLENYIGTRDRRKSCIPDALIKVKTSNGQSGAFLMESLDEVSPEYMIKKMYGEGGFSLARFQAQLYVVRSQFHFEKYMTFPSLIGHTTPLLSTQDAILLNQIIMGSDMMEKVSSDLDNIGLEYTYENIIKAFYLFAEDWIPDAFPGIGNPPITPAGDQLETGVNAYDQGGIPARKKAMADLIMRRMGFLVDRSSIDGNPPTYLGKLVPFEYKDGVFDPSTGEYTGESYGPKDCRQWYINMRNALNPSELIKESQELLEKPYEEGELNIRMKNPYLINTRDWYREFNNDEFITNSVSNYKQLIDFLTKIRIYEVPIDRIIGTEGFEVLFSDSDNYNEIPSHSSFYTSDLLKELAKIYPPNQAPPSARWPPNIVLKASKLNSRYRTQNIYVGPSLFKMI